MKILDCTLRDGGYCNHWEFGYSNIKKIIKGLCKAGIDIIECGFLTNKVERNCDMSQYNTISEIEDVIVNRPEKPRFVCMMNYNEYDLTTLPGRDKTKLDGIRLAFHKRDVKGALQWAKTISEKGYLLFLQPMVTLNYTDEEFLHLIKQCNELSLYAFYIVDSFGVMKQKDLIRLFYLIEHNLDTNIAIGFHSHNNMQLAYSNAQALLNAGSRHELIIDASVYGMGRGAGNLNTELFVEYVNDNYKGGYELKPLLTIIDEILSSFHQRKYWGYSLPNYLSARYNTHPSYANFLDSKKTLTMDNMDDIFAMMDDEKRVSFDRKYIEELYIKYLSSGEINEANKTDLVNQVAGKCVLLIAPGQSSLTEKDKVLEEISSGTLSIGVNFDYKEADTDYIFLSNMRRYRAFSKDKINKCIVTSNLPINNAYVKVDYKQLLNWKEAVIDNAGLMLVKLLIDMGCTEILLAGLDGFDYDLSKNFVDNTMRTEMSKEWCDSQNEGITEVLREYKNKVNIRTLTTPRHIKL